MAGCKTDFLCTLSGMWLRDMAHDLRLMKKKKKLENFQHMCRRRLYKIYLPMKDGDELSTKMKGKNIANQHPGEKETATVDWLWGWYRET